MTNQEILIKAIEKAEKNGWNYKDTFPKCPKLPHVKGRYLGTSGSSGFYIKGTVETLIFSHSFAKAFWGKDGVADQVLGEFRGTPRQAEGLDIIPLWQYHLQQQVISDDPIRYLFKGL